MKVLIVRHGAAGDPEAWTQSGRSDDFLPLTEEGKAKCRGTFSAIKAYLETLDAVAVSPLTRAIETAEILVRAYPTAQAATNPAMKPDADPDEAIAWLMRKSPNASLALIGHEPHLNGLIARMCGLREDSVAELKEGGCALVEFEGKAGPARGNLLWVNKPKKKS